MGVGIFRCGSVLFLVVGSIRSVEDALRRFGRPMTVFELVFVLDGVKRRPGVYKQIRSGLVQGVFVDLVLDLRPLYRRKVRLIGLNRSGLEGGFSLQYGNL